MFTQGCSLWALLSSIVYISAQTDPCKTHSELSDDTRSALRELGVTELEVCDRRLVEGWYLFKDPKNGTSTDMPNQCIPPMRCASSAPVWVNDTLPKKSGDVKKVKLCKRSLLQCCDETFDVEVKNCGTFNVYHLLPLRSCAGRYCTIGTAKCQPGYTSESGYEPCTKSTLAFTARLTINPTIPTRVPTSPERQLNFRCIGSLYNYRSYIFDIKYIIDGIEIKTNTYNLSYNEISTRGAMKASDWLNSGIKKTLNFKVKCLMRIKKSVGSQPSVFQESDEFYAGIKLVNSQITVNAGQPAQIRIVSTVPVACYEKDGRQAPCQLEFEMLDFKEEGNGACNKSESTKPSACGLVMDGWRWNYQTTMSVKTLRNPKYQTQYTALVKLRCITGSYDSLWKDLEVPDVPITIINNNPRYYSARCGTYTDPNLRTTDDKTYSHYGTGEFVLYAHKKKSIAVNVIHQNPPGQSTTYICAVAVQAASDVFIIYGCDQQHKWIIRRLNCQQSKGAYLEIFERSNGREYEVHLPTGTRVRTVISRLGSTFEFLNIDVFPSAGEVGQSHGLCGHFDGNSYNDFVDIDGKPLSDVDFKKYWSVKLSDSLFVAKARNERLATSYVFCTCVHNVIDELNGKLSNEANCTWKDSLTLCQTSSWTPNFCDIRHKRDASIDEDAEFDVEIDKVVYKAPSPDALKWKNGWNESAARDYCTKVLHNSVAYKKCNGIPGLDNAMSIDSCINDIKVAGSAEFAEASIHAFKSSCENEVRLNVTLSQELSATGNGKSLLEDIVEDDCPNDCVVNGSRRGSCYKGVCQCQSGFVGYDCSIETSKEPLLVGTIKNSKCDVTKSSCASFPVFGTNFYQSLYLQCRYQERDLNDTLNAQTNIVYQLPGTMKSFGEINCPLPGISNGRKRRSANPFSPKGFLVSITTNGNAFSNQIPIIVYDSACSDCSILPGSTMKCSPKNNICVVQGSCYPLSSSVCGGSSSRSTSDGPSMTVVIAVAVIGGAIVLCVFFLIIVKLKMKSRKTHTSTPDLSQNVIYSAPSSTKYPYKN